MSASAAKYKKTTIYIQRVLPVSPLAFKHTIKRTARTNVAQCIAAQYLNKQDKGRKHWASIPTQPDIQKE